MYLKLIYNDKYTLHMIETIVHNPDSNQIEN